LIDNSGNTATALLAKTNGSGTVFESQTTGTGKAGHFQITNTTNNSSGIYATTNGTGRAGEFYTSNINNNNPTISAKTMGTAEAGRFEVDNQFTSSPALYVVSNSSNGSALMARTTTGTGDIAVFKDQGNFNVVRINYQGTGYFNGGTQNNGADLAEAFEVEGEKSHYEPGDVLVISESTDRTVEKSSQAYSTLVAGVYATKPGVLLREDGVNNDLGKQVPMGVVGVIPTKVCDEGGKIKRGDLLVTSSKTGYAMKGDPAKLGFGQILGKALQDFDGNEGKIKVLVNVR
jgi:signal peptidase I